MGFSLGGRVRSPYRIHCLTNSGNYEVVDRNNDTVLSTHPSYEAAKAESNRQ